MKKDKLKEDRIHGDPLYPLSVYHISRRAGEPLLDLHWHEELEFLTVTKGRAVFRVDIHEYELSAGEAIFINSGELHSGATQANEDCDFKAVVFHADILGGKQYDLVQDKYIQPLLVKTFSPPAHLRKSDDREHELLTMLEQVFELNLTEAPVYELATKGLLQMTIAKLLQLGGTAIRESKEPVDRRKIERIKLVLAYMETNIGRSIRLRELAELISVSEAYFCRFFKEITAKSPVDYLNQLRMQKAAGLLKDTDKKMTEIALDVGFGNLSYFIGVFKQHFGCTPSAYRKRR